MAPTIDFERLAQSHWSETERSNARLVSDFVQMLMNDHDIEGVRTQFGGGAYVQHNRTMPTGIPGVTATIERLVKRFPGYSYDVKNIIASGDKVVLHSHVTMQEKHRGNERKGFIIFDMWQVEDGAIVEHWDSMQALDLPMRMYMTATGGRVRNADGVF